MKEFIIKSYSYCCRCGYAVKVFIDCGIPVEQYRCRVCGIMMNRKES